MTHRSRQRWRGERHGNLEWKGVMETLKYKLQCTKIICTLCVLVPWLRSMLLSDFDILIPLCCSTRKIICFWAIFHCLPLFRQAPVWLGRSSKNMYKDEPEWWNHFAFDSLNGLPLERSAAVIASLKNVVIFKMTQSVDDDFYCHTMSNRYQVFDVICIALWECQWIFPI